MCFFFFFGDLVERCRALHHFTRFPSAGLQVFKKLACLILWVNVMVQWIFLLWPRKKPKIPTKKRSFAHYVGCSPVILWSWIVSLSRHVTFATRAQGHREISPKDCMPVPLGAAPGQIVALERMRSLSLSLALQHPWRGWVIQRAGRGRGLNSVKRTAKYSKKPQKTWGFCLINKRAIWP